MIKELKDIDVFEIAFGRNPKNNKKFFVVKDGKTEDEKKKEKEATVKDATEKVEAANKAAEEAQKVLKDLEEPEEKEAKEKKEKDLKDAKENYEVAEKVLTALKDGDPTKILQKDFEDAEEKFEAAEKVLKDLDPDAIKDPEPSKKDSTAIDSDVIKEAVKAFKDISDRVQTMEDTVGQIVGVLKDATMLTDIKDPKKEDSEKDKESDASAFDPFPKEKK